MTYVLVDSDFHGGEEYGEKKSLTGALLEQSRHRRECCCGGPVIVIHGTAEELAAAGAYETVCGDLILRRPQGDFCCEAE